MSTRQEKLFTYLVFVVFLTVLCIGVGIDGRAEEEIPIESFGTHTKVADYTKGGHLEKDFGVNFLAEWWYLNGKAILVSSDGDKKELGFFVTMAHQESPFFTSNGVQLSQMLHFCGLYFEGGSTTFNYADTFIPQAFVSNYITLKTPYVNYAYPDGSARFYGSALPGYRIKYRAGNADINLLFQTNMDKTTDHADYPLNFTTYEYSYGTLSGSLVLDGKRYVVTRANGYFDHMIPMGNLPWPMNMHGWSWSEVTTKNYQVVTYAIRGLDDGYDNYSYKHLTLLDKHNGKVIAEYFGDEVTVTETTWIVESGFARKRPSTVIYSTNDLSVTVSADSIINFDRSSPSNASGFVDFMAFQEGNAAVQYNFDVEHGSGFFEYLVSDMGVVYPVP